MPVSVPRELRAFERQFRALGTPGSSTERAFLATVREELKPEIRNMYSSSADPFGSAWTRDKDGRPAYQSKKMGNAIGVARIAGGLAVREWVKWIRAADEGHTWPERTQQVALDKNGRMVRLTKRMKRGQYGPAALNRRAQLVQDRRVGARTLPPRRQQPGGRMPDAWGAAINRGAERGMTEALTKATGNA